MPAIPSWCRKPWHTPPCCVACATGHRFLPNSPWEPRPSTFSSNPMSLKIAIIGNGYWGRNLIRNFHELGALAAICDESPLAEASAREKYPSIPFHRDYTKVLADPEIQAVVLATPAVTHYPMARL